MKHSRNSHWNSPEEIAGIFGGSSGGTPVEIAKGIHKGILAVTSGELLERLLEDSQ